MKDKKRGAIISLHPANALICQGASVEGGVGGWLDLAALLLSPGGGGKHGRRWGSRVSSAATASLQEQL